MGRASSRMVEVVEQSRTLCQLSMSRCAVKVEKTGVQITARPPFLKVSAPAALLIRRFRQVAFGHAKIMAGGSTVLPVGATAKESGGVESRHAAPVSLPSSRA